MADRKVELEKKRKKLEELKKARKQVVGRDSLSGKSSNVSAAASGQVSGPSDNLAREREDLNKLVSDLIGDGPPPPKAVSPAPDFHSVVSPEPEAGDEAGKPVRRRALRLVVDTLAPVNIRPKAIETYTKTTQTSELDEAGGQEGGGEEGEGEGGEGEGEGGMMGREVLQPSSIKPQAEAAVDSRPQPPQELTEEQKERIVSSEDFSLFMERAARLVERALCDSSDIMFDTLGYNEDGDNLASVRVAKKIQFFDDHWSAGRIITSMDWSNNHPELLLVSHYKKPASSTDPDGVALLWDLKYKKDTPDYIFNSQSAVMSACFSDFHPSYIIGGTYSGQIALWDIRSGKHTPVQRSPLSSSAHTHPVYCVNVVGSQNAHNLLSISTDGKLCSWNIDMLSHPQDTLELQSKNTKPVAATCLSFPCNDVNKFVVGSEECVVFQGQRHGSKPGIGMHYEGHFGPLTAVSCHKAASGQVDFSHLFLSSSFDWTIKLWSLKLQTELQLTSKTARPLCSFENNTEYVYDVQWSPVHPALFASVDGEGRLDFWNINADTEVPILSEGLDCALSKCRWSPNGHYIACGDVEGKVHVYEAGEGLCAPHAEEWLMLQQTLLDLQDSQELTSALS